MAHSELHARVFFGAFALSQFAACGGGQAAGDPSTTSSAGGSSNAGAGAVGIAGTAGIAGSAGGAGAGGTTDQSSAGSGSGDPATGGSGSTLPAQFTLSVTVDGDGKVVSTPAGIECGATCQGTFPAGTIVQLQATEQGGVLTSWADACSGGTACSVTLNADTQVSATFAPISVGGTAHGVAVTPDGSKALVTLSESPGALKVISLDDYTVLDTITLGAYSGAVVVTPDGSKAVVNDLHEVSLVTLATKAVATVPSPCASDTLYDIAVTPDGANAVTTMFNSSCVSSSLAVIALGSASMANQFTISADGTQGIAVTRDGASALVSEGVLGTKISRVTIAGGASTDISNTSSSFGIAVTPDGSEALIASGEGDTIKRVSLTSNTVTGTIDYGSNQDPHNIAVTPDGKLAVVAGDFDVGVLSLASGSVAKKFSGGGRSVAITPDGKRALVTLGSTLRVFSLQL